jgi:phage gp36-like protein
VPLITGTQYATANDLASVGATPAFVQSLLGTQITEALVNSSGYMDGYFSARWVLPLLQWDGSVVKCCVQIGIFDLIRARGYNPMNPAEKIFADDNDRAEAWLTKVAKGIITPQVLDSSPGAQVGASALTASPNLVSPITGTNAPPNWATWKRR